MVAYCVLLIEIVVSTGETAFISVLSMYGCVCLPLSHQMQNTPRLILNIPDPDLVYSFSVYIIFHGVLIFLQYMYIFSYFTNKT